MQFVYAGWVANLIAKVISKIIAPVVTFVGKIVMKVFLWAFDTLLKPVLVAVFKEIWDFLKKFLSDLLADWLHDAQELIIDVLNSMLKVAGVLIGAERISIYGKNVTILEALMEDEAVRGLFYGVMILSIALLSVLSMYAMLKAQMEIDPRQRRTAARAARSVIQAFITFVAGYAYVYIVVSIGNVLINVCCMIIDYCATDPDRPVPVPPDVGIGDVVKTVSKGIIDAYGKDSRFFGYAVSILFGLMLMMTLLRTALSIVRRVYDIILLYVTQPVYAASIVLDDGATYKRYRDFFNGRVLIGIGTYISLLLMAKVWAPFIGRADIDAGLIDAEENKLVGLILQVLLIHGGIKSCENVPTLLGQIVGDHAAMVDMQARQKFDAFLPFDLGKL